MASITSSARTRTDLHDKDEGFSIHEHVFERVEMLNALEGLAHAPMARTKAGARHVLLVPVVRRLATDRRLVEIAETFLGGTTVPFRATLFDKSPAANWLVAWHQDTALPLTTRVEDRLWGPWSVKSGVLYAHAPASALSTIVALRVHLDDSTVVNGPLRPEHIAAGCCLTKPRDNWRGRLNRLIVSPPPEESSP